MKNYFFIFIVFANLLLTACSSPYITNTSRSAVEQLLICTTIERGISKADFSSFKNKIVKLDYSNLDPQVDKNLIMGYLEIHLSKFGIVISKSDLQKPEYIIQVLCGVLATDVDKALIGTPALPIPIPDTSVSVVIPEIPLYRRICRTAYGRFYFNVLDADTLRPIKTFDELNSKAKFTDWTIFMIPFKSHNVLLDRTNNENNKFIFID